MRTDGFSYYTYEAARRAKVDRQPASVSNWQLQSEHGENITMSSLENKTLLVNFIFTRCPFICRSQGSRYSQLQDHMKKVGAGNVALLSISIDPDFDTPQRLQYYREAHKGDDKSWYLTRPVSQQQLRTIVKETGLRIIPDELGGYTHSESIHVLQNGKITSIYDWDTSGLELLITNAGTTEISQLDASIQ